MSAMKIGYSGPVSAVPQRVSAERSAQQLAQQKARVLQGKTVSAYGINKEDAITCRETAAGSYEAIISGTDPAVFGFDSSRKGQLVDLWI